MVTFQRRRGEAVVIDTPAGRVYLDVLQVRGTQCVRLGITADPAIPVRRGEVAPQAAEERKGA